jgi:hypothetical protein
MVLAPEVADATVAAGDALAKVFLKAIQVSRTPPKVLCINNRLNSSCQGTTSVVPHTLQNQMPGFSP